jgi:hypothetical protein
LVCKLLNVAVWAVATIYLAGNGRSVYVVNMTDYEGNGFDFFPVKD